MFNRICVILFLALLSIIFVQDTLQAIYIPDLWEDIWEEEERIDREEIEQWLRRNIWLYVKKNGCDMKAIADRLRGEERYAVLNVLFDELKTIKDYDQFQAILTLLFEQIPLFRHCGRDKFYSVEGLKDFFEWYLSPEGRVKRVMQKTSMHLENLLGYLKDNPFLAGIGTGASIPLVNSNFFSLSCDQFPIELVSSGLLTIAMIMVMDSSLFSDKQKAKASYDKGSCGGYMLCNLLWAYSCLSSMRAASI